MNQVALTEEAKLAERARAGLRMVAEGEHETMLGWLCYGKALNEGRKLFPSNELFGQWKVSSKLEGTVQGVSAAMVSSNYEFSQRDWRALSKVIFFQNAFGIRNILAGFGGALPRNSR